MQEALGPPPADIQAIKKIPAAQRTPQEARRLADWEKKRAKQAAAYALALEHEAMTRAGFH